MLLKFLTCSWGILQCPNFFSPNFESHFLRFIIINNKSMRQEFQEEKKKEQNLEFCDLGEDDDLVADCGFLERTSKRDKKEKIIMCEWSIVRSAITY